MSFSWPSPSSFSSPFLFHWAPVSGTAWLLSCQSFLVDTCWHIDWHILHHFASNCSKRRPLCFWWPELFGTRMHQAIPCFLLFLSCTVRYGWYLSATTLTGWVLDSALPCWDQVWTKDRKTNRVFKRTEGTRWKGCNLHFIAEKMLLYASMTSKNGS